MKRRPIPAILRRGIDPSWDVLFQYEQRLDGLCELYTINKSDKHRYPLLVLALAKETFPHAFQIRAAKRPDPRCVVNNLALLKQVAQAIQERRESGLDPEMQRLVKHALNRLADENKKINKTNICYAISKVARNDWRGIAPATLRDNLYRPPGSKLSKAIQREILSGLQHTLDEIERDQRRNK